MKTLWIAMVLAVLVTLNETPVSAVDRLCINADNSIRKLYIDGEDYTKMLKNRNNVRRCDCIEIPVNSGVIAVEATNLKGTAGIQSCNTANPALAETWHCRPVKHAKSPNWFKPNYNDQHWKPSKGNACDHCQHYFKLPCKMSASKCYWSNQPSSAVRCRIKQCADGCSGCKKTGYGKCDPGMCVQGSGVNILTGKSSCNRRCRIEARAWSANEAANGYVRVTDLLTKNVDTWNANAAGDYYATVDMTNCTITNKKFAVWSEAATKITQQVFNKWNSPGPEGQNFIHVIGIELGVGTDGTPNSFAPWIGVAELGLDTPTPVYAYNRYHSFSAVLTGVQNGNVKVTDKVLVA